MLGAPKCRGHTSEGYASREKSTLLFCSVLGEISFAVALTKSYQKLLGLCVGGDFFRCSINQKLPKEKAKKSRFLASCAICDG